MKKNDRIPALTLSATGQQDIDLSSLQGKKVVLYFYPRDNTSGCTQEGEDFRDHYAEFSQHNTVILGVSRDSVKTHEGFKAKYNFPFDLLADRDEILCQAFDVLKPKMMFGKTGKGIVRSTFLFDEQGILQQSWSKVKVDGHVLDVLDAIKKL